MGVTADTGTRGEQATAEHLRRAGYDICAMNWRDGHYELDIVARRFGVLHFIEVKTRRNGGLTPPEAALTIPKQRSLQRAAVRYLAQTGWQDEVQFDLAAVDILSDGSCRIRLIENAMETNW